MTDLFWKAIDTGPRADDVTDVMQGAIIRPPGERKKEREGQLPS